MKQITKNLYTLRELEALPDVSSSAIEKAKQHLIIHETEHDWWDFVYDTWEHALEQIGFTDPEIQFRGFWSQGDGASFESGVDLQKLVEFFAADIQPKDCIEPSTWSGDKDDYRPWIVHKVDGKYTSNRFGKLLWVPDAISLCVKRDHYSHYVHKNTCRVDYEEFDHTTKHPRFWKLFEEFREHTESLRKELCQAIYSDLEEFYEALTSDDNLRYISDEYEIHFDTSGDWEPTK